MPVPQLQPPGARGQAGHRQAVAADDGALSQAKGGGQQPMWRHRQQRGVVAGRDGHRPAVHATNNLLDQWHSSANIVVM